MFPPWDRNGLLCGAYGSGGVMPGTWEGRAEMAAHAIVAAAGDLTGNWSGTVWLLIPGVIILAVVTALAVGPLGEPERTHRRARGVSQYLERHAADAAAAKEDDS